MVPAVGEKAGGEVMTLGNVLFLFEICEGAIH
jgi:hypothetical protein